MEVYLIRHTTPAIEKGICYGQFEVALNEALFEGELEIIRGKIPASFDAVFSSPLKRCTRLAGIISGNYVEDNRLKELDFGRWENKRWQDLAQEELTIWMNDFVNVAVPGGESYLILFQRVTGFLNDLFTKDYKTVALVTHAGCIRGFLALLLGLTLENTFRIQLDYGEIVHAEFCQDDRMNKLHKIF